MALFRQLILLGFAGALGTLSRYTLGSFVQRMLPHSFPFGTLTVNVLGCFLFGLLWQLFSETSSLNFEVRFLIFSGFMGAFTTFSSYIFETSHLLRNGQMALACINFLAQNILGFSTFFLGIFIAQLF